jgi:hypothetical protein
MKLLFLSLTVISVNYSFSQTETKKETNIISADSSLIYQKQLFIVTSADKNIRETDESKISD